jgi:hypothetical protein
MLEITDDSGTPVTGSDGKPAVAMILESAEEASGNASVTLTVGTSPEITGGMESFYLLLEPGTNITSDLIEVFKGPEGLLVTMCSEVGTPQTCTQLAAAFPVGETGQPQEIAVLPSPIGIGDLHVIVDSIPEPSVAALIAVGLGCMSIVRRSRTA